MNRFSKMIPMLLILAFIKTSPVQIYSDTPLVHTYSIVAFDSLTGQIGAAVQSHWFRWEAGLSGQRPGWGRLPPRVLPIRPLDRRV